MIESDLIVYITFKEKINKTIKFRLKSCFQYKFTCIKIMIYFTNIEIKSFLRVKFFKQFYHEINHDTYIY